MMNAVAANLEFPPSRNSPSQKARLFHSCFGKVTVCLAWFTLIGSILIPPTGIGITICWTRSQFGLPCPGCGLTRSLSHAMHGHFYESWMFHPFGPLLLAMFIVVAVVSLLPEQRRAGLVLAMESRARLLRVVFIVLVAAFCGYGFLRALLQLSGFCLFNA